MYMNEDKVYISIDQYTKRMEKLRLQIVKARSKNDWINLSKYMHEAKQLDDQFKSQQFSVEDVVASEEDRKLLTHSVLKLTVLSDLMNGALIEMKERMKKAGVHGSDLYDTCLCALRINNEVVKAMDKLGTNSSIALEYITSQFESKYMLGMDNDLMSFLTKGIEIKE